MNFSILMSVYYKEQAAFLCQCLDSLLNQTVKPTEIVLVKDGRLTEELDNVISDYQQKSELIKIIALPQNVGLGNALNEGLKHCSYYLVARMDSDDIALPDRFEKQLQCFKDDNELSIVGGVISEFIDTPDNIVAHRICPTSDIEIKKYMKSRCGLNHVAVMFKKAEVIRAGGYLDWFWNEDYYLWIRMLINGAKFRNLENTLVNVRVGRDMYARRGGWKYFKSEAKLQRFMFDKKVLNVFEYCFNVSVRFVVQVLMPNSLRAFVFQKILRT